MPLLEGKRLLVTGVLTEASIAFAAARVAQQEGAQVVLSGFGRGLSITQRIAARLPDPPDVLELDVARDLGGQRTRVNLVAAGPIATIAAKGIPGFGGINEGWSRRAPLGWDTRDTEPVARVVCALLSDFMPAVTGEIVHVDGGAHAMGADVR